MTVVVFLMILINFFIIQTKVKVTENILDKIFEVHTNKFIDKKENLRKYYLKNYIEDTLVLKYGDIKNNNISEWILNISSVNLVGNIFEGTTEENLNKYIGHFEESKFLYGNIGLAAHNRGYPVNYFEDLDKVKIGDYIDYRIDNIIVKYKINSINVIRDTDWTYLENTNEDKITLITCVKNRPKYRLCVQAHKESEEFLNNAEENFNNRYHNGFIIKCDINRVC